MSMLFLLRGTAGVLAMLALTVAVYWQGLSGNYLFDDFPNIVENTAVHVTSLDWHDWKRASAASAAHDLPRPMSMLSYAANYYFTGADPWPMKLTNLLIHLANGALLYSALRLLLNLWSQRCGGRTQESAIFMTALGLSCAWLICPINLSPVLYVVQRMESLAQTFVLAGMLLYLHGRRMILNGGSGIFLCTAGLMFGTTLGLLCKETAVMLPLYAFAVELTVLRFTTAGRTKPHHLWMIYTVMLFVPGIIGLAWLLPHSLSAGAYSGRPFTLTQRLYTELRVLVDYIVWTLLPHPGGLGFYHDDISLSQSWLSPPATLGSGLVLATLAGSAAALRQRLPLYSLGISWYFAAHLLTATVIPLELVFEHRNYFASVGLLLAVSALIVEIPPTLAFARRALVIAVLSAFCFVTTLRAHEWGDTVRFAFAEAREHPNSPRANYELGRTLAVASGYRPDSKLIEPAMRAFEQAVALPGSDAAAAAGLIVVASHMHREVKSQWWQILENKLAAEPPTQGDISALQALANCQYEGACSGQSPQLLSAFLAALNHPSQNARLLAIYGSFSANQLGDYSLAANMFSEALSISPNNVGYGIDLAKVLLLDGKIEEARKVLKGLEGGELDGAEAKQLDDLKGRIVSMQAERGKA